MSGDNGGPGGKRSGMQNATTGRDSLGKIIRRNLSFGRLGKLLAGGRQVLRRQGLQALGREVDFRLRLATHREVWRYRSDIPLNRELAAQRQNPPAPAPLVSILVPLYNTPAPFLRQMVESVLAQSYGNWELVLADGSGQNASVETICRGYAAKDGRIHYLKLKENLGICGNTDAAFAASAGDWLTLLDHDDTLQPNALYEVIGAANRTGAQLVYSDEIVLEDGMKKLGEYHFKGDYGPHTLEGCNYITHLCAFSRQLVDEVLAGEAAANGESAGSPPALFRPECEGAQDYDLILRLTEQTEHICHIPKVLYFWRRHGGSTAADIRQKPQAVLAGQRALQAHLARLGEPAAKALAQQNHPGAYRVVRPVAPAPDESTPLVSVLIPSSDHSDDLARCLASLYEKGFCPRRDDAGQVCEPGLDAAAAASSGAQPPAPAFEVLVIDNNSKDPATEACYRQALAQYPTLRVLRYKEDGPFNYSKLNNFAAKQAKGRHLLLLNNDVEILSDGFLAELASFSALPNVGAVGAKLLYPDDTIQHAGLIVGIGGTAGASHKGHPADNGGDMFRLCTVQNVSAVTGAALMVKRSLYEELGGLDEENFGVAFNDVDFCLRLRERGLWNVFTPFALAHHYESKSRGYDLEGERKARFDRETAAYQNRWAAILAAGDPFYNPHFTLKTENFAYR